MKRNIIINKKKDFPIEKVFEIITLVFLICTFSVFLFLMNKKPTEISDKREELAQVFKNSDMYEFLGFEEEKASEEKENGENKSVSLDNTSPFVCLFKAEQSKNALPPENTPPIVCFSEAEQSKNALPPENTPPIVCFSEAEQSKNIFPAEKTPPVIRFCETGYRKNISLKEKNLLIYDFCTTGA